MLKLQTLNKSYLSENFWLADSTKDTTKRAFRYFALAVGNRDIEQVCFRDVNEYKAWLLKSGRSKTTANIYLRSLNPVFGWAVRLKLLEANPCDGVKQFKVTQKPIRVYEDWQFERMYRYAPNLRWKAILLTGRTAGLRRGEILNLTLDNFRDKFIYVEPKRNTNVTWEWEPKDNEIRKVPLVPQLAELIVQLTDCYYPMLSPRRYQNILRLKQAGVLTGWVRRCPSNNFRRTFVAIQRRAFGRQIGDFHSLRKTYITQMANNLPDYFVLKLSGHSDVRTMVTYYTACRDSMFDDARKIASAIKIARAPVVTERPATIKVMSG